MNGAQNGIETLRIRAAVPKDRDTICALLQEAGLPIADIDDVAADRTDAFLIADNDKPARSEILGLIGQQRFGAVGLLRSLVVSRHARGKGLGRRLVRALEANARGDGVSALWLLTIDAEAFFQSLGYRVADRMTAPIEIRNSREFSELCPGDAVLMVRSLSRSRSKNSSDNRK